MIFIAHACYAWLVCCLLSLNIPANFTLSAASQATWLSSTFTSTFWQGELWPIHVSLVVFTEHCLMGVRYFPGNDLCKNVTQSPWWFLLSVHIGIPLMDFTITPCVHGPPLSHWTDAIAPVIEIEWPFWASLPWSFFIWRASNASWCRSSLLTLIGPYSFEATGPLSACWTASLLDSGCLLLLVLIISICLYY